MVGDLMFSVCTPILNQSQAKPTEEQLKEYRDIFNLFDKNKDGQISCAELINVCKVLNMNMTEVYVDSFLRKFFLFILSSVLICPATSTEHA
jgi:Ca2+-binding EF-hand superfamily protein